MKHRRSVTLTQVTSLAVAAAMLGSQAGCVVSSTEIVNTDRVYLLGPKTESEPGPATRDVTLRAVDTQGTIAFHLDRARECTVTSTPRFQRVHIEGKQGKNIAGGLVTGSLLTAGAAGLIAAAFVVSPEGWTSGPSDNATFTGGGYLGLVGVILGIAGMVVLPRAIYHAAVSGTTVTPHDVEAGTPPPGAVRAPSDYDPKNPEVRAYLPLMERPQFNVMAFGAQPAGQIQGFSSPLTMGLGAPQPKPLESLRSARDFDAAVQACDVPADASLLAIPQSSDGASDPMRACVQKYTPGCQSKCGSDKACVLECLRKPCVENIEKETGPGSASAQDEYTQVITRTEVCERAADAGVEIAVIFKDADGVPKTVSLGRTDKNGDVKKNVLAALEGTYPGWPDSKAALLQEAQIVLVEDPSVVLGRLDLAKYPALAYDEHVVSTKKQREALVAAEAARKEKEARDRQAALEAAAKAEDDRLHADERKAEAAKKAQQCAAQRQSQCNAECQGVAVCVKRCLQKPGVCK